MSNYILWLLSKKSSFGTIRMPVRRTLLIGISWPAEDIRYTRAEMYRLCFSSVRIDELLEAASA